MDTLVATLRHKQARRLSVDIYETENGDFYFDKDGDYYNDSWCEDPFLCCQADAQYMLHEKFNGTYYQESYGEYSERRTFRAMFG
jgi:hypothetical protein